MQKRINRSDAAYSKTAYRKYETPVSANHDSKLLQTRSNLLRTAKQMFRTRPMLVLHSFEKFWDAGTKCISNFRSNDAELIFYCFILLSEESHIVSNEKTHEARKVLTNTGIDEIRSTISQRFLIMMNLY